MAIALWLYQLLFWLAIINLSTVLICFGLIVLGGMRIKRLADVSMSPFDKWPSVSLIAAARNEERNIERAVRSLVLLDYPNLEITIVNDRSSDRTGAILDRLAGEFPQLNVVHLTNLPAQWLGKNHALQIGADRSRGEWLLFTDADIIFEPTALRRAISYAVANQVDHLAVTPDTRMTSWLLTSFVVTFSIYFSLFVRIWSVRSPRSRAHVGIGAFNLVQAAVYRTVGGHERIRMRPDDDVKLGKIVKLGGFRQDIVHGGHLITVNWYYSLAELIHGLEKNAFSATDYSIALTVVSSLLSLAFNVWPYVAVFVVAGPLRWIYIAVCLALWAMAGYAAHGMKVSKTCALGFPLGVLLLVYIQWRTMLLNYYHGGIRWRDTHYSLAELMANKV
jgi:glycosyltransferase involved in cell wall biosynthesis